MLDVPIRHSRKMRSLMLRVNKANTVGQMLQLLASIRPDFFEPELPVVAEFSSGKTMGHSADCLAASFNASRQEQGDYALRSYTLAKKAQDKGYFTDLVPFKMAEVDKTVDMDDIRVSTKEALAKLRPAIVKSYGTVTVTNASFLTE